MEVFITQLFNFFLGVIIATICYWILCKDRWTDYHECPLDDKIICDRKSCKHCYTYHQFRVDKRV